MNSLRKVFNSSIYQNIGLVAGGMVFLPCLFAGAAVSDSVGTKEEDPWHDAKCRAFSYSVILGGPIVTGMAWPVVLPTVAYMVLKED